MYNFSNNINNFYVSILRLFMDGTPLRINTEEFEIDIIDESMYSLRSTDNVRQYVKEYVLGDSYSPRYGIQLKSRDSIESNCFILGSGVGGPPHENSAIVVGKNLFVAIGNLVCKLVIPDLKLEWYQEVDFGISYAIYLSPDQLGVISHGELEITKIDFEGEILWRAFGRDIFSGELTIFSDRIEVFDFYDDKYEIDPISGECVLLPP